MATNSVTNIQITACDNELYLIAATTGTPWYSTEICHIKSGNNLPVSYSINPSAILAPGNYNLFLIGLDWGVEGAFTVTLTVNGVVQPPISLSPTTEPATVWSQIVPITI